MDDVVSKNLCDAYRLFHSTQSPVPPGIAEITELRLRAYRQFYYPGAKAPVVLQEQAANLKATENSDELAALLRQREEENSKLWIEALGNKHISPRLKTVDVTWHPPWQLMRVISGHTGWVRTVTVDPTNHWFATGSTDQTIKIWDVASGQLKLTLQGHISPVRGVVASDRHPYLFSCAEDKTVYCWDLEHNTVIRSYHGHLSGVYCLSLHPTLDVLVTGSRDCVCRVWDLRTKTQIRVLEGHRNTVLSLATQAVEPQAVSGSADSTIKLWDLGSGKAMHTLTRHKKGVRALLFHHTEYTLLSGAADNLKLWKCPEGKFLRNFTTHDGIINGLALNESNVLVSIGDDGRIFFWDYESGFNFQQLQSTLQPGSLACEAGVLACAFDRSGLRLITAERDKTIKIWKEDEEATPLTHPIPAEARVFLRPKE